jgi:hypothetical protein
VGYRSGEYAQSLIQNQKVLEDHVLNHEGILMHTYLNKELVKRNQISGEESPTFEVHVYAYPWSGYAHPDFNEVYSGQGCVIE